MPTKSHGGRQVGGPDEDPVDAAGVGNRVQRLQALGAFNLREYAQVVVCLGQIVRDSVPARCPGQCAAHAADTVRRVARRPHERLRLLAGLDHRYQQCLAPEVQNLLHMDRVVARKPDYRSNRVSGHHL